MGIIACRQEVIRYLEDNYKWSAIFANKCEANVIEFMPVCNETIYIPFIFKHKGYTFRIKLMSWF